MQCKEEKILKKGENSEKMEDVFNCIVVCYLYLNKCEESTVYKVQKKYPGVHNLEFPLSNFQV